MKEIVSQIAKQQHMKVNQIEKTLALLEEGNTVPFIARYRKEVTEGLDEDQIRFIQERYAYEVNLEKRKEDVSRLIAQQGKLTEELMREIKACEKLSQIEDIYRPYQQKRKTRASDAIALGLEPLADWLYQLQGQQDVEQYAQTFLNEKVKQVEDALQGAMDILAERVSDDTKIRQKIRFSIEKYGKIVTKAKKKHTDEKKVYQMYYEHEEKVFAIASHRVMAIDRGEKEKILQVSIEFDKDYIYEFVARKFINNTNSSAAPYLQKAIEDGLKRLAYPSVEREIRSELTEKAQEQSMDVFSMNVEKLLLQPPMKDKMVLGFDPAFRTGCKLAVIDKTGKLLKIAVIYPHPPVSKIEESEKKILELLKTYPIDIIAIGNGTASRESEAFIGSLIHKHQLQVSFTLVSEAGASVYSASKLAKEEFPNLHVEERSAISIARRIIDPLSELIKIDPQSIGVGQYQHDLSTTRLKERLDFVVTKAVNRVGVNINTASIELLKNISGLNQASATSVVAYRDEHGRINNRSEIKKIPKIGAKSFQQSVGFLRIPESKEYLDQTGIHPESYPLAKEILASLNLKMTDLGSEEAKDIFKGVNAVALSEKFMTDVYTVQDILDTFLEPLRDYRDRYDAPMLRQDILDINDLHIGEELEGTVRNVVDFGAFVDIGLHEDGLIHISKMSKKRIAHPNELLSVGDIVKVYIYNIDKEREKVQLSLLPLHEIK